MIRFREGGKRWSMTRPGRYPWDAFVVLSAVGFIAFLLTLPFPPNGLTLLLGTLLLTVAVGFGLIFLLADGLPIPIQGLRGRMATPRPLLLSTVLQALLAGTVLGTVMLAMVGVLSLLSRSPLQERLAADIGLPVWQRILIAFDSAVLEELIFRLFLLSMLAWFLSRLWTSSDRVCGKGPLWTANVLVAVGFGMAHLPQWTAITALTPTMVGLVVALNGMGGVTFGYLYFARGLGSAMVAHFAADIVLHVIGPNFPVV